MTAPARFRQADLARTVRALQSAGAGDKYKIIVDNGVITLLPADAGPASDAENIEQRMRRAFGET